MEARLTQIEEPPCPEGKAGNNTCTKRNRIIGLVVLALVLLGALGMCSYFLYAAKVTKDDAAKVIQDHKDIGVLESYVLTTGLLKVLKSSTSPIKDPQACAAALAPWATPIYSKSPLPANPRAVFHGMEASAGKGGDHVIIKHGSRPNTAEELVKEVADAEGQLRALEGFSATCYTQEGQALVNRYQARTPENRKACNAAGYIWNGSSRFKGTGVYFTDNFSTAAGYGAENEDGSKPEDPNKTAIFLALVDNSHANVEDHLAPVKGSTEIWYQAHPLPIEGKYRGQNRQKSDTDESPIDNRTEGRWHDGPDPKDQWTDLGKEVPLEAAIATHAIVVIGKDEIKHVNEACRLRANPPVKVPEVNNLRTSPAFAVSSGLAGLALTAFALFW